jgi:hypothetical protein
VGVGRGRPTRTTTTEFLKIAAVLLQHPPPAKKIAEPNQPSANKPKPRKTSTCDVSLRTWPPLPPILAAMGSKVWSPHQQVALLPPIPPIAVHEREGVLCIVVAVERKWREHHTCDAISLIFQIPFSTSAALPEISPFVKSGSPTRSHNSLVCLQTRLRPSAQVKRTPRHSKHTTPQRTTAQSAHPAHGAI